MAIIVDSASRIIIQGITGTTGKTFAERMSKYYDTLVGGVTPGKGGKTVCGKPVFDFVADAVKETGANTSLVVVPSGFVKDAAMEAIDAGIKTMWIYTDKVPVHDAMEIIQYAILNGVRLIGPNSAGVVSPGKASAAEHNEEQLPLNAGHIGLLSKSGSLSYEVISLLHEAGFGFSTVICIGGDPVLGTSCRDVLDMFEKDSETEAVVMIGEIGGTDEIDCEDVIQSMTKPVVAYISGHIAPEKKKMGHAGAIIGGAGESAKGKSSALRNMGVAVSESIEEIPTILKELQKNKGGQQ